MPGKIDGLTTEAIARLYQDPQYQIIDARPVAAYNGWRLNGEARGGHIPGARSIPLRWTQYLDWIDVLEQKAIHPERPVIVYGDTPEETRLMAGMLLKLGYESVIVYNRFQQEWAGDPQQPLEHLPRYRQLVYPAWVDQVTRGEQPAEHPGNNVVICHCHFDNQADYEQGHVPGAVSLDTNRLESPGSWDRRSPEVLREALLSLGIRRDTTVVMYGRFSYPRNQDEEPGKSAGHLSAMRCAAIMLYAGVQDVRILDGGMTAWQAEGYPVSTSPVAPRPAGDFGAVIPVRAGYMIDTAEAKALLAAEDGELVSMRSWLEYIGEYSGYHYVERKGRVPGSIFGDCGSDAYHMENYRNLDHTVRESQEVALRWAASGITPDKRIAFCCGTGWRASEAFMNAYLMGWDRMAVYDGGWLAWSGDPANPVETGVPEAAAPGTR